MSWTHLRSWQSRERCHFHSFVLAVDPDMPRRCHVLVARQVSYFGRTKASMRLINKPALSSSLFERRLTRARRTARILVTAIIAITPSRRRIHKARNEIQSTLGLVVREDMPSAPHDHLREVASMLDVPSDLGVVVFADLIRDARGCVEG